MTDHAALPPATDDRAERMARLRLIRSPRVGPITYRRLIAEHGSGAAALAALPQIAAQSGVAGYTPHSLTSAQTEIRAAQKIGAKALFLGEADYPTALAALPDAPPFLWAMGDLGLLTRPMVALVGTRNASALGRRMARVLARDLGQAGFVSVSGLARGIDTEAHDASCDSGTIAVLAGGVDVIYPAENAELATKIGLRLSEMPMGQAPQARHFPRRNRIIAGLSGGVVVVEAALRSGSMITARMAADYGREVMAVPGHPLDTRAAGCNLLLREGAHLIRDARDVIAALDPIGRGACADPSPPMMHDQPQAGDPGLIRDATHLGTTHLGAMRDQILSLIGTATVSEDQLARDLRLHSAELSTHLTTMEIGGDITRSAGGMVARRMDQGKSDPKTRHQTAA